MRTPLAFWLSIPLAATACNRHPIPAELKELHRPAAAPVSKAAATNSAIRMRPEALGQAARDALAGEVTPTAQFSDHPFSLGGIDDPTVMIIRTGTASIRIDSLEPALANVRALAARVGGYVANTDVQAGTAQYRQATLEVKVPAGRFDDLVAGLQPLGKVESVNVSAEEVGEEFVDVSARVENSRRLESRLIDLLATKTGRLQDVLAVERELARVREEIERYEGRLRYLRAHAATSSLAITVHEPIPVVGVAGSSPLGDAARQAWWNFVGLLALLIQSLGVVVPLGLLALGAWPLLRRARRTAPA